MTSFYREGRPTQSREAVGVMAEDVGTGQAGEKRSAMLHF